MVGVAAVVISFLCLGWCKEIMTAVLGADYDKVSPYLYRFIHLELQ
jgi:hypothetical protein